MLLSGRGYATFRREACLLIETSRCQCSLCLPPHHAAPRPLRSYSYSGRAGSRMKSTFYPSCALLTRATGNPPRIQSLAAPASVLSNSRHHPQHTPATAPSDRSHNAPGDCSIVHNLPRHAVSQHRSLSPFPVASTGPLPWSAASQGDQTTKLTGVRSSFSGHQHLELKQLHDRYGPIVRTGNIPLPWVVPLLILLRTQRALHRRRRLSLRHLRSFWPPQRRM